MKSKLFFIAALVLVAGCAKDGAQALPGQTEVMD